MSTFTLQFLVVGSFVIGLGILSLILIGSPGNDRNDFSPKSDGAESSTASDSRSRPIGSKRSGKSLLLWSVTFVSLFGLAFLFAHQRFPISENEQSIVPTQVSRNTQNYLDQAALQLGGQETLEKAQLGWLPFEPDPGQVDLVTSTPQEVVEGVLVERVYRHENTFSMVIRLLLVRDVDDTENWDSTYFREFWRNSTCSNEEGLEHLQLGGIWQFIALANNDDVIGRVQVAIEDCLEDLANFKNKVPMRRNGDLYEVLVDLDESVRTYLVIDSGASDVSLSPSLIEDLFASGALTHSDSLEPRIYVLADGSEVVMPRFMLNSMYIGGRELTNVVIAVNESDNGLVLLGQSVLKELGRYSIDYQRQLLVF